MVKKTEKLYMELSALENRGVTIWLEGNSKRFPQCIKSIIHSRRYLLHEGLRV